MPNCPGLGEQNQIGAMGNLKKHACAGFTSHLPQEADLPA